MTTFKHPAGKTWRYDFRWKGRRYTGTTDQLTKADADLAEAALKTRLRQQAWGIAPIQREHTPTFTDWAAHFYAHQQKRLTRPDLLQRTLRMVLAFFGRTPTKEIPVKGGIYHDLRLADPILDPEWLTRFDDWMQARGIAGATRNTYRSALSGMYKLAMRPAWRKKTNITVNPVAGMERDRTRNRKVTLTIDQLRAWILASPPHVRLAIAIAALAPKLRLASILALRWDQNFDAGLTYLTVYDHKTIRRTGEPQAVPIDPQLKAILEPFRVAAKQAKQHHVITYRGKPIASIRKALERAAMDAGVEYGIHGATFHSLRHTMATMLAELGVPEKQRQMVMGHSDPRTTALYTHLRPRHEQAAHAQLSAAVRIQEAVQGPVQGRAKRGSRKAQRSAAAADAGRTQARTPKPQRNQRLAGGRKANS